jgi:hypothetical protein
MYLQELYIYVTKWKRVNKIYRNFMLRYNIGGPQNEYLQELYNLMSFRARDGIAETLSSFS